MTETAPKMTMDINVVDDYQVNSTEIFEDNYSTT